MARNQSVSRARATAGLLALVLGAGPAISACSGGGRPEGSSSSREHAGVLTSGRTRSCAVDEHLVPRCGALWGAYAASPPGRGWVSPFTTLERHMARRFDIVKRYHDWSGTQPNGRFPDQAEQRLGSGKHARILYLAWSSSRYDAGTHATWRDIASGRYDRTIIKPEARRIKRWGHPVFLDFDHEMDDSSRRDRGTPAQFVRAYRHIHQVFARTGVTNVEWVWVSTGWPGNAGRIAASYPGNVYVDWIGFDPYNFSTCNGFPWRSPRETIAPFYHWLVRHGHGDKPFMLAEYGSIPGPGAAAEPRWYDQFVRTLPQFPKLKAVIEFDAATSASCDFRVGVTPGVLRSFSRASRYPYVNTQ